MRRRCAWCGLDMGRKEPLNSDAITHGICPPCSEQAVKSLKPKARDSNMMRTAQTLPDGQTRAAG